MGDYSLKYVEGTYLFWLQAASGCISLEIQSLLSPVAVLLSYTTPKKIYFQGGLSCGLADPLEQGIPWVKCMFNVNS